MKRRQQHPQVLRHRHLPLLLAILVILPLPQSNICLAQKSNDDDTRFAWPTLHEYTDHNYVKASTAEGRARYHQYMKDCYRDGYEADCEASERSRILRNVRQPKSLSKILSSSYATLPIPSNTFTALSTFWQRNYPFCWPEFHASAMQMSYQNHWESPTHVLEVGRKDLPWALSDKQRDTIVSEVQASLEELTNTPLVFQVAVGIRAYSQNTILAPRVDPLPFALTAVLHIAENDVEDGWPLQVVTTDEHGNPTISNIHTRPGEMIVYEGTSVIHGRPYPMKATEKPDDAPKPQQLCRSTIAEVDEKGVHYNGTDPTYVAALYLHFEPIGYTMQQTLHQQRDENNSNDVDALRYGTPTTTEALDQASKAAFEMAFQAQQNAAPTEKRPPNDPDVPRYVWKEYQDIYQQKFVFQHEPKIYPKSTKVVLGTITAHQAAALGDVDALKSIAKNDRSQLFKADMNGWRPLHEAARSGYADALEYLLEEGAQVNARTNDNKGGTALYWAEKKPKENAKAIAMLKKYGGVNIPPGYKDDE